VATESPILNSKLATARLSLNVTTTTTRSFVLAGFVTAQCRAALPPAALQDAVSRLAALVPSADRQPLLAGAAALALGYLGSAGRLPDLDPPTSDTFKPSEAAKDGAAGAAGANGSAEEAKADKDEGAAAAAVHESAAVMVIAKALPAPTVGPKEVSQAAAAAVARCALAVGLACRGEDRSEVLRAAVKGAGTHVVQRAVVLPRSLVHGWMAIAHAPRLMQCVVLIALTRRALPTFKPLLISPPSLAYCSPSNPCRRSHPPQR
jgi:hypothetical protein